MATLTLSNEEIDELISILNTAIYDIDLLAPSYDDPEMRLSAKGHQKRIKEWIHRLSQFRYEEERFRLDTEQ